MGAIGFGNFRNALNGGANMLNGFGQAAGGFGQLANAFGGGGQGGVGGQGMDPRQQQSMQEQRDIAAEQAQFQTSNMRVEAEKEKLATVKEGFQNDMKRAEKSRNEYGEIGSR